MAFQGMIVYVNYARESDFQWLADQGINVNGRIVLARYGKGGRSGKVSLLSEMNRFSEQPAL